MAAVWTRLLLLGVFVAVAHGLTCRQCPIGILGRCLFPREVACDNTTSSCFFGNAGFNATGSFFRLHNRGCLPTAMCGVTQAGFILTAGYTSDFTCCTTDLCNGGTSVQLSLAAVGAAMLASLWAR